MLGWSVTIAGWKLHFPGGGWWTISACCYEPVCFLKPCLTHHCQNHFAGAWFVQSHVVFHTLKLASRLSDEFILSKKILICFSYIVYLMYCLDWWSCTLSWSLGYISVYAFHRAATLLLTVCCTVSGASSHSLHLCFGRPSPRWIWH